MKKVIFKAVLCNLFVLFCLLTSCDSGTKSNIESTADKGESATEQTQAPAETQTSSPASPASPAPASAVTDASLATGEKLYSSNCVMCHKLSKEALIGPGLAGINERRPQDWLIPWIKNSTKMIESGDKYAVELFNKYNKVVMPSYDFSDDEIKSILAYIDKAEQL
jgi:cytochrome c2